MRSSIAAAVVVFFALVLAAQPADPQVEQAKALLTADQPQKAADILEQAVAAKPNDAVRHYWLGNAYGVIAQEAGMFKAITMVSKVKKEFARAVALDPNYLDARFGLMEFYLRAPSLMGGDQKKALEQASEIRKRDAFEGHRAFATIAAAKKDTNAARAEYLALVRENPASPKAHYDYAVFLMIGEKNYKAANDEFEAALKLDPNFMPATFQVGHVAALSGMNLAHGREALEKYLAYKPTVDEPPLHRAHYWLGLICEKEGKRNEARAHFETSLHMHESQDDVKEALRRVS